MPVSLKKSETKWLLTTSAKMSRQITATGLGIFARRMKGPDILTQADTTKTRDKKDVIHIGGHFIDSHHVACYAVDKDHFINEGRIRQKGLNFAIPCRIVTPKPEECRNLLVPVCILVSVVTFCTIRLEPTWVHLSEASGIAVPIDIRKGVSVQDIDISDLQKRIIKAGIPLGPATISKNAEAKETEGFGKG
jgi:hypothetical protein